MSVRENIAASGLFQSAVLPVTVLQQGVINFPGSAGNEVTVPCVGFSLTNCTVNFDNLTNPVILPVTVAASAVANVSFTAKGATLQAGTAYYQVLQANSSVTSVNAP